MNNFAGGGGTKQRGLARARGTRSAIIVGIAAALAGAALGVGACVGDTSSPGVADDAGNDSASNADTASNPNDATPASDAESSLDAGADACAACGTQTCFEGVCGGNKIVQVSSGYEVSCALTLSGSVYCWGRTSANALGSGAVESQCSDFGTTVPCQPSPTKIVGLDHVSQVSNSNFGCAVRSTDHAVLCWGGNDSGQLGHDPGTNGDTSCGTAACNATPLVVAGLADATEVHVGDSWACALTTAGKVKCWGRNDKGNLGQGTVNVPPLSSSPLEVQGISNVTTLAVSTSSHACAVVGTNGSVWCWGDNGNGALGHSQSKDTNNLNGTATPTYASDQSTVLTGFSNVSSGTGSCLVAAGLVSCDGPGFVAQLGTPGATTYTPQPISGVTQAKSTASWAHVCALLSDGRITCWGTNENGALGRGTIDTTPSGFTAQNAPAVITGISATQISAFPNGMLALTADGKVLAWGTNTAGQLGHVPGTNGDATCYQGGVTTNPTGQCGATPQPVAGLP